MPSRLGGLAGKCQVRIDNRQRLMLNYFEKRNRNVKKKVGRNDPCPCGSNKKFKKCCEKNMIANKFLATKASASTSSGLTQLFHKRVEPPRPLSTRKITAMPATSTQSSPLPKPVEQKEAEKPSKKAEVDPNKQDLDKDS